MHYEYEVLLEILTSIIKRVMYLLPQVESVRLSRIGITHMFFLRLMVNNIASKWSIIVLKRGSLQIFTRYMTQAAKRLQMGA